MRVRIHQTYLRIHYVHVQCSVQSSILRNTVLSLMDDKLKVLFNSVSKIDGSRLECGA